MNVGRAVIVTSIVLGGTLAAGAAQAGDVYWSVGVSVPNVTVGVANAPPVVYRPAPIYYPAPVYAAPAPRVVYVPQPVYVARPPVHYYGPTPVHAKRHWRHWERRHRDGRWHDRDHRR